MSSNCPGISGAIHMQANGPAQCRAALRHIVSYAGQTVLPVTGHLRLISSTWGPLRFGQPWSADWRKGLNSHQLFHLTDGFLRLTNAIEDTVSGNNKTGASHHPDETAFIRSTRHIYTFLKRPSLAFTHLSRRGNTHTFVWHQRYHNKQISSTTPHRSITSVSTFAGRPFICAISDTSTA